MSKLKWLLVGMGMVAYTTQISAQTLKLPKRGVLCDEYVCVASNGVSKKLTAQYLGQQRSNKIVTKNAVDMRAFVFSNGLYCDTDAQLCYVNRYFDHHGQRTVDAYYSNWLYGRDLDESDFFNGGSDAQSDGKASSEGFSSPAKGVLCDGFMCADASGVSRRLTVRYLGNHRAQQIPAPDLEEDDFTFADGSYCDTQRRLCYQSRYNQSEDGIDAEYTEVLFGQRW